MHRIDGPGNLAGQFTEGDPQLGDPPTKVTGDWLNDIQGNVATAIEAQGITLVKGAFGQLAQAIRLAASGRQAYRNVLVNGSFEIHQRTVTGGQSNTTVPGPWVADRWFLDYDAGVQVTGTPFSNTDSTPATDNFPHASARGGLALTNPLTGAATVRRLRQRIEDVRTLSGRPATLSFWAKVKGTSGTAKDVTITPSVRQYHGPAGNADVTTTFAPVVVLKPAGVLEGEWVQYAGTITVPPFEAIGASAGFPNVDYSAPFNVDVEHYLELRLDLSAGAGDPPGELRIVDVQLEDGPVATQFEVRPFPVELALCQRYFEASWGPFGGADYFEGYGAPLYIGAARGRAAGTRAFCLNTRFRVAKAKTPVVTWFNPETNNRDEIRWGAADVAVTAEADQWVEATGDPTVGSSQAEGDVFGQWMAEAEL